MDHFAFTSDDWDSHEECFTFRLTHSQGIIHIIVNCLAVMFFWKQSLLLLVMVSIIVCAEQMSEDDVRRAIRMKTSRQLKSMFAEADIAFDASLDKDGLQERAYVSNLMEAYWKLHPDKRPTRQKVPPPSPAASSSTSDFGHVQDPVKRRALESLKKKGINIGMQGGAGLSLDAIIDMDRQTSGLPPLEKNDYDPDL
jgi:hypothetical protein